MKLDHGRVEFGRYLNVDRHWSLDLKYRVPDAYELAFGESLEFASIPAPSIRAERPLPAEVYRTLDRDIPPGWTNGKKGSLTEGQLAKYIAIFKEVVTRAARPALLKEFIEYMRADRHCGFNTSRIRWLEDFRPGFTGAGTEVRPANPVPAGVAGATR